MSDFFVVKFRLDFGHAAFRGIFSPPSAARLVIKRAVQACFFFAFLPFHTALWRFLLSWISPFLRPRAFICSFGRKAPCSNPKIIEAICRCTSEGDGGRPCIEAIFIEVNAFIIFCTVKPHKVTIKFISENTVDRIAAIEADRAKSRSKIVVMDFIRACLEA